MKPPRKGPARTATGFDKGLALHQQGRLTEAEQVYRAVLRTTPAHFDALHLLGVLAGQTARLDEAHALLLRALAQRPHSAAALNNLGNTLGSMGRDTEAVAAFEQALAVRPNDAKTLRNRATSLGNLGRHLEALASLEAAIELLPSYAEAWVARGELLLTLHQRAQAIESFQRALQLGHDVEPIRYALAALGVEATPPTAPHSYVAALFDGYAQGFDQHLVQNLAYRTPELLVAALQAAAPPSPGDIVDLGCGTGLCGPLLQPLARQLVGIDLSGQMLAKARATGPYTELVQGDIASLLAQRPQQFDIAIAADVFVYIGDLQPVFAATQVALRPGGLFAFSVEATEAGDFQLGPSRRYAHSLAYLQRLAASHGLQLLSAQHSSIRKESDQPVDGLLVVMRCAAASA